MYIYIYIYIYHRDAVPHRGAWNLSRSKAARARFESGNRFVYAAIDSERNFLSAAHVKETDPRKQQARPCARYVSSQLSARMSRGTADAMRAEVRLERCANAC